MPEPGPDEIRRLLGLEPHPTCGYVSLSFVDGQTIAPGGLPEPFAAVVVDETEPLPILTVRAPEGWDISDVQKHLDISEAANSFLHYEYRKPWTLD